MSSSIAMPVNSFVLQPESRSAAGFAERIMPSASVRITASAAECMALSSH